MNKNFDVVVIGAGPAGYVCAIRAAQLGLTSACIESESYDDPKGEVRLGGTCLNVGCIPSKALLRSSELFDEAQHSFVMHGISAKDLEMNVTTMMRRKDNIVSQLTTGIRGLFKKNKVELFSGRGSLVGREDEAWQVAVRVGDTVKQTLSAKHVIIATGSKARHLEGVAIDNQVICDNVGALAFKQVPKRLGIIGAGVIGLELGSVWKRLGADVTILEALPDFLAAADPALAKEAWKIFTQRQGLKINLGAKITKIQKSQEGVILDYEVGDAPAKLECDKLIVSIGRVPNTDDLGCETIRLKLNSTGHIEVNDQCSTNLENIWAIGDVVRGPMLAHRGMEEGVMVAELISGQVGHVNYDAIPWVVYTHPEMAWIGQTETALRNAGIEFKAGQVPFLANGRALGQGDITGFVKMLACAKTDKILGVHIIGANASELIAETVVAMEFGATAEDIARICHAHPTLSEVVHEAALALDKRSLHF